MTRLNVQLLFYFFCMSIFGHILFLSDVCVRVCVHQLMVQFSVSLRNYRFLYLSCALSILCLLYCRHCHLTVTVYRLLFPFVQ